MAVKIEGHAKLQNDVLTSWTVMLQCPPAEVSKNKVLSEVLSYTLQIYTLKKMTDFIYKKEGKKS